MQRKFVCIICPNSCHVDVEFEGQDVTAMHGVECQKGREYIVNEVRSPLRTLTGSVNVRHGDFPLVSIKTSAPVPKSTLKALAQLTHELEVKAPVEIGQVLARNVLGQGVDFVATRRVRRKV